MKVSDDELRRKANVEIISTQVKGDGGSGLVMCYRWRKELFHAPPSRGHQKAREREQDPGRHRDEQKRKN